MIVLEMLLLRAEMTAPESSLMRPAAIRSLYNHFVGECEYLTEAGTQTVGAGTGPKNIRSIFSFPITRASSCIVQYMKISTSRMI
jgi:hypothetical protein